ncbi:hypothetical protein ScPMuIL_008796 [Solemya velum]
MLNWMVIGICLSLAVAVQPLNRKRRALCPDTWANVPNVCQGASSTAYYFPHPNDAKKFMYCDSEGGMFIIQCPKGQTFSSQVQACLLPAPTTPAPTTTTTPAPTTVNPNPCRPNPSGQRTYHDISGDAIHFIECDLAGQMHLMSCPPRLQWNNLQKRCVFNAQPIQTTKAPIQTTKAPIQTTKAPFTVAPITVAPTTAAPATQPPASTQGPITGGNPCTQAQVTAGNLYFANPADRHQFIQCDLSGNMYIQTCPKNLFWDQSQTSCGGSFGK